MQYVDLSTRHAGVQPEQQLVLTEAQLQSLSPEHQAHPPAPTAPRGMSALPCLCERDYVLAGKLHGSYAVMGSLEVEGLLARTSLEVRQWNASGKSLLTQAGDGPEGLPPE